MNKPAVMQASLEFPVKWDDPEEGSLLWTHDKMHYPYPETPLSFEILSGPIFARGITNALRSYGIPVKEIKCKRINSYLYWAVVPSVLPPEEMKARGKRSQEAIMQTITELGELWSRKWLSEIKQHLEYWDNLELQDASMEKLMAHFESSLTRFERLIDIHFSLLLPSLVAISEFEEMYKKLLGNQTIFDAHRLLQGFDNKTLETGRAIRNLARRAIRIPNVREIFEELPVRDILFELEKTSPGQEFLRDFREFLAIYGKRSEYISLQYPLWTEDPTPVLTNLKDYIKQLNPDSDTQTASLVNERERLIAEVSQKLQNHPKAIIEQFKSMLAAAQTANMLSEEHTFWLDYGAFLRPRLLLLEIGRRFVEAGVMEKPEDIFYLLVEEIRETAKSLTKVNCKKLVQQRRSELENFQKIQPPPILGTAPLGSAPTDPVSKALGKLFGLPLTPSTEPNSIKGNAGSSGKVRGFAKVVRSLGDAAKLQEGDVLVTETTSPPWTPLFATASAVVTDVGGILSHCAVVAREYRIPAVVGTGIATKTIRDGQFIEVDGDSGTVTVLNSP